MIGAVYAHNDDQLRLAAPERLQGGLVSQSDLAGLHDQGQTGVDAVGILLVLLGGHCECW